MNGEALHELERGRAVEHAAAHPCRVHASARAIGGREVEHRQLVVLQEERAELAREDVGRGVVGALLAARRAVRGQVDPRRDGLVAAPHPALLREHGDPPALQVEGVARELLAEAVDALVGLGRHEEIDRAERGVGQRDVEREVPLARLAQLRGEAERGARRAAPREGPLEAQAAGRLADARELRAGAHGQVLLADVEGALVLVHGELVAGGGEQARGGGREEVA